MENKCKYCVHYVENGNTCGCDLGSDCVNYGNRQTASLKEEKQEDYYREN
jgi:hypothetical protein